MGRAAVRAGLDLDLGRGGPIDRVRRLLPPRLVVVLAVAMTGASAFVPGRPLIGRPWRATGALVATAGLALTVRSARVFDRVDTNVRTFDDPDHLVDTGAFARTRNPMYLGFGLALAGVALMLGTAVAWLGPLAFLVAADRWYVPFEERRMTARFGSSYEEYRARVPRWIRFPWR